MIPSIKKAINSEPIDWELKSHTENDGTHKYEYCAESQYEDRKYHLYATANSMEETQHLTFR